MKIRVKEPQEPAPKRGRRCVLGGERANFFPGEDLIEAIEKLEVRRKKLNLPHAFPKSYVFREGAWIFVRKVKALMKEALGGNGTAKTKLSELGQKLKKYEA